MMRHLAMRGMAEEPELMADTFVQSVSAFLLPYLEPDPTCTVEVQTL